MSGILLLDQSEKKYISQLQVGQAIVKLQSNYTKPFLINVPFFKIERARILSDNEIRTQNRTFSQNKNLQLNSSLEKESNSPFSLQSINNDDTRFLLSLVEKPFLNTATRYSHLMLYKNKGHSIKNKLRELGLINDLRIQVSDNQTIKLSFVTEQGKVLLRSNNFNYKNDFESKGGLEHAFWVNFIKHFLIERGFKTRLEFKGIDLVALKQEKVFAIEIETGNSYPTKNILKSLNLGFTKIISVATNLETFSIIKRFIVHYKLQERVLVILAKDLSKEELFNI